MLVPTNREILSVILHTLKSTIQPALSDHQARSAAQTAGHLLRFVSLRMDTEGSMLFDECHTLRAMLESHRDYFASLGSGETAARRIERLTAVLAKTFRDPEKYLSLDMLAREVSELREALYANHRDLIELRDAHAEDARYVRLRNELREYIVRDITEEAAVVDGGFDAFGPRR